jgi:hypothetical protein
MGSIVSSVANIIGGNQANKQQQSGYSNANGILNDRYGRADAQIMEGYNNARDRLSQAYPIATNTLQSYADVGRSSNNELRNLIDTGYASRQFNNQDLKSGLAPNYEFQLKQGQGNAGAMANTAGGMLSGNALQGLNTFTQNFAQNAYQKAFENFNSQRNNIFTNLNNTSNMAAAPSTALANLQAGYGSAGAGLDINQAQNQANLNTSLGQYLAGNNINAGNAAAKSTLAQYDTAGNALSDLVNGKSTSFGGAMSNIGNFFRVG